MVAADDPLVGLGRTGDPGDDVVDGLQVPIKVRLEVDLRRARPDVVRHRKPSPPAVGSDGPSERRQHRLRVGIRKRQSRNGGQHLHLREREPLRILGRAHARRERVSGVKRHIHHAAALHAVPGPPGALRERFTFDVAVLAGVGIDQAADRPVLGRDLGLDAAPARPVSRDDDRPFDRDAQAFELLVVAELADRQIAPALPAERVRRVEHVLDLVDSDGGVFCVTPHAQRVSFEQLYSQRGAG